MIDDSEKRNLQLACELQNLRVCEKHSNRVSLFSGLNLENIKGLSFPRNKANCL